MSRSKLQALSSSGDLFAYSEPSGILKFWDTISGKLVHEFQPAEHVCAQPTCLQFLKPNKKGMTGVSGIFDRDLLAIGNIAGKILIYSPKQQRLVSTLTLNNGSSIVDIAWQTNSILISLAKDTTLTTWTISNGKKISEYSVNGNRSLCSLGESTLVVAGYSLELLKQNNNSIQTLTNYIGKSQEIVQLLPLVVESTPIAKYFLSALNGSKLLYAWLAEPQNNEYLNRSLTIFNAEDTIEMVSCAQLKTHLAGILCTTKKGVKYFSNYFNGVNVEPHPPKKVKAEIIIKSETTDKNLNILGAYFLSSEMFLVCYGSTIRPAFERIPVETLNGKKVLSRIDPMFIDKRIERNFLKTVTPKILPSASYLTAAHVSLPEGATKRSRDAADKWSNLQKSKTQKV